MNDLRTIDLLALREAGGLQFFYPGCPMARRSGIHQTHTDQRVRNYKEKLGWAAKAAANAHGVIWYRAHIPMPGAIVLGVTIFRKAPITNKPDLDNYLKLVADALQQARIYVNDAQIVEYFPGTAKQSSATEGVRVIVVPKGRMEALGFGRTDE